MYEYKSVYEDKSVREAESVREGIADQQVIVRQQAVVIKAALIKGVVINRKQFSARNGSSRRGNASGPEKDHGEVPLQHAGFYRTDQQGWRNF